MIIIITSVQHSIRNLGQYHKMKEEKKTYKHLKGKQKSVANAKIIHCKAQSNKYKAIRIKYSKNVVNYEHIHTHTHTHNVLLIYNN